MVTRIDLRRRAEGGRLFFGEEDRWSFLQRAFSLAQRWQLGWLAFGLNRTGAVLLVEGEPSALSHWTRLLQSGHGVWSYHRGEFLCWEPALQVTLAEREAVLDAVCDIHGPVHGDPISRRWCSLRDAVGLRKAPWFDPGWLQDLASPLEHYRLAGGVQALPGPLEPWWRAPTPVSWVDIDHAVASATGQNPGARIVRNLRTQGAFRGGWSVGSLSQKLGVGRPAIRRALRLPPHEALHRTLLHLKDERLGPSRRSPQWSCEPTLQAC